MSRIRIDNREVEVPEGATILDAAAKLGIDIPTLCFLPDRAPSTSCMVCLVRSDGKFIPSCAALAQEGMLIETNTEEVAQARRDALQLLLAEHVGDCDAPCQTVCPARMNIPLMIRQIATGDFRKAIATVKRDIAIPAVLGRICPAPCEKACRRSLADHSLAICLLKRFVADIDLASEAPYLPGRPAPSGRNVAIVGAGPAGLSAGYYLSALGHDCTIFDENDMLGGMLARAIPQDRLPPHVLAAEIDIIRRLGTKIETATRVGRILSLQDLQRDFDAVLLATGTLRDDDASTLGLELSQNSVPTDPVTFQTDTPGLFAAGNAIRPNNKLAVRSAADGKDAAVAIDQYLRAQPVTGPPKQFNSRMGKLLDGEIDQFMIDANPRDRVAPSGGETAGFTEREARSEATRCLHCNCRAAHTCKLRSLAHQLAVRPAPQAIRRPFVRRTDHPEIIYEPGKCIRCGICITVASEHREPLGLAFIARGFETRVGVPFDRPLSEGLTVATAACVAACPTGALAFKRDPDPPKQL